LGKIDVSLYVILDRAIESAVPIEDFTLQVIRSGASCLQVRCKHDEVRSVLSLTARILSVAAPSGIPVIINDRLDIALASGAQGVHLGEDDLPVRLARELGGPGMIVGASAASVEVARQAEADGADYIGVGPVFRSPTKPEAEPVTPGTLAAIRRGISLPIVAIGGITEANLHVPLAEGADGIAVISALRQCPFPGKVAARLKAAIETAKKR
jgi:thiamine-phosphate pyrophosphorylase